MVIRDGSCTMLDGNGDTVVASNVQTTATLSENGNVTFKCSVKEAENDSGRAVRFDFASTGFTCQVPAVPFGGCVTTENWHETVSKSGNATLICRCDASN
jgi:hypothetical protein